MQTDYFIGGKMAMYQATNIIPQINRIKNKFKYVFFILDWHTINHTSFRRNNGKYPIHCLQHSPGAKIHKFIKKDPNDIMIKRGTTRKSESAFYNDDKQNEQTPLNYYLYERGITDVYVCGGRVYHTLLDAYKFRYKCHCIYDLCMNRKSKKAKRCINFLKSMGVKFMGSSDI